jgi:hypothetical protein
VQAPLAIHHEDTKDTKDTKDTNNNSLVVASPRVPSVFHAPFVSFVPSW